MQLILCWISNLLPQGQVFGRSVISKPHRSLIESQNWCLDGSNRNYRQPVWVDISARRFSLSFIYVIILSMAFLHFSSFNCFISVLSFFRLSLSTSYCRLCCLINVVNSYLISLELTESVSTVAWNIGIASPYLIGGEISTLSFPVFFLRLGY